MTEFKRYLVSYRYEGGQWNIELPAQNIDDARNRLSQLSLAKIDGEVIATVPSAIGPFAALTATVRNLWINRAGRPV